MKALYLFVLVGASAAASAQEQPRVTVPMAVSAFKTAPDASTKACKPDDPSTVIVCGRSRRPYRIDRGVLAAEREVNAPPIKPPVSIDNAQTACIGPDCGNGGVIPVIGMVLVAASAVAMAADGDDWRQLFRTHDDEYQAYLAEKRREAKERKVKILGGLLSN